MDNAFAVAPAPLRDSFAARRTRDKTIPMQVGTHAGHLFDVLRLAQNGPNSASAGIATEEARRRDPRVMQPRAPAFAGVGEKGGVGEEDRRRGSRHRENDE